MNATSAAAIAATANTDNDAIPLFGENAPERILVKFTFANKNHVPEGVPEKDRDSDAEVDARHALVARQAGESELGKKGRVAIRAEPHRRVHRLTSAADGTAEMPVGERHRVEMERGCSWCDGAEGERSVLADRRSSCGRFSRVIMQSSASIFARSSALISCRTFPGH